MFRVQSLGASQVCRPDGRPVRFRSRKHLALLVYLALTGPRQQRRERLVGLLWPEDDEARARHSLSQSLYALKGLFGEEVVEVRSEEVQIGAGRPAVDALEFEEHLRRGRLADAAALYRGEFLEGFWVRGARPFEEWMDRERARLAAEFRQALRTLIRDARERGEWDVVMERGRRLIQLEPYDEQAYADLMRALWIVGDRAGALREYEVLRDVLASELESEPGKEIQELAARVRRRTAEAKRKEKERKAGAAFTEPPFIGRKEEYAQIVSVWERVKSGESAGVVLTGEPGIGKTRLAEEFLKYAATEDALVLRGGCYPFLQGVPYAPFAEALRSASLHPGTMDPLDFKWKSELALLFPELTSAPNDDRGDRSRYVSGGVRLQFEAVAQLFNALSSRKPVALFVDNLQWSDAGSQGLAMFLLLRLSKLPLLLLTATRRGVREDWPNWPSHSEHRLVKLTMRSLSAEETARLVQDVTSPLSADDVYVLSRGNPLYVLELCRVAASESQQSLPARREARLGQSPERSAWHAIIERRLTSLSRVDVRLLELAAVIGEPVPVSLLGDVSDQREEVVYGALDRLGEAGLIVSLGNVLEFTHDLIHEAIYSGLPLVRRRILHARIAATLAADTMTDEGLSKQAWHYDRAGDRVSALESALTAARRFKERQTYDEAQALAEIAVRNAGTITERTQASLILGEVLVQRRRYTEARSWLREVQAFATEMSDFDLRVRIQNLQLRVEIEASEESLTTLATRGEQTLDEPWFACVSDRTRVDLSALLLAVGYRVGSVTVMRRAAQLARDLAASSDDRYVVARMLRVNGVFQGMCGNLTETMHLLERRLSMTRADGSEAEELEATADIALVAAITFASIDECRKWYESAISLSNRLGDALLRGRCYGNWASTLFERGYQEEAELNLLKAHEILAAYPDLREERAKVESLLGDLEWHRGDWRKAGAHWAHSNELTVPSQPFWLASTAGLGLCALATGEVESAREYCTEAYRALRQFQAFRRCCPLPTNVENVYLLSAMIRLKEGRSDSAVEVLRRAARELRKREVGNYLRLLLGASQVLTECRQFGAAELFVQELIDSASERGETRLRDIGLKALSRLRELTGRTDLGRPAGQLAEPSARGCAASTRSGAVGNATPRSN